MKERLAVRQHSKWAVGAAMFAALGWSLSFIVPFVIGKYSIFDFALLEFLISGIFSSVFLLLQRAGRKTGALRVRDCGVAGALGTIGYLGYFLTVAGAAIKAGPLIAPAFLGLVPIVLAIIGNLRQRTVRWRELALPLALAIGGLALVNGSSLSRAAPVRLEALWTGIPLALAAVILWTCFGLLNQTALDRRPGMNAGTWTALMMIGAGVGMVAFMPLGMEWGLFEFPRLGFAWRSAGPLYVWAAGLAIFVNAGSALAWTYASQRLPAALSAQMITLEPTFGTVFGLCVHREWPSVAEAAGIVTLLFGVVLAIRVLHAGPGITSVALHSP